MRAGGSICKGKDGGEEGRGDAGGRTRNVLFTGETIKVEWVLIPKASDLTFANFIFVRFVLMYRRNHPRCFSILNKHFPPFSSRTRSTLSPAGPRKMQRTSGKGERLGKIPINGLVPTLNWSHVPAWPVDHLYVSTPDTHQEDQPGLSAGLIAFHKLPRCPSRTRVPHSCAGRVDGGDADAAIPHAGVTGPRKFAHKIQRVVRKLALRPKHGFANP